MNTKHFEIEDFYKILLNKIDKDNLPLFEQHLRECKDCREALLILNDVNYTKDLISNEYLINLSIYKILSKIIFLNFQKTINYKTYKLEYRGSKDEEVIEFKIIEDKYEINCKYFPKFYQTNIIINIKNPVTFIKILKIDNDINNNSEGKIIYYEKNPSKSSYSFLIKENNFYIEIENKIFKFL